MARTKQAARKTPANNRKKRRRETDILEQNLKRAKIYFDIRTINWKLFFNHSDSSYATGDRGYDFLDVNVPTEVYGEALVTILKTLELSKIYGEKFLSINTEKTEKLQKELQIGKYSEHYFPEDEEEEEEFKIEPTDNNYQFDRECAIIFDYKNWELGYICIPNKYHIAVIYLFDFKNSDYFIVGTQNSHPFIHCIDFDYANSDGSGPRLVEIPHWKINSTYLLDKMQFFFRSFCNDNYH